MRYRVEFSVLQQCEAEIEIPDDIHHTKWKDYIQTHLDKLEKSTLIGEPEVTVYSHYIEPVE